MIVIEQEFDVRNIKKEKDSEGKEKKVILTLSNAALDPNFLSAKNIILSNAETIIRKN